MKKSVLRAYARLIAESGVNVQKGQEVFITAGLDQPEFVAMVVEECYRRKAKKVVVDWNYQPLTRLHVRHQSLTTMSTLDNYEEARWQHYVDTIPCRIYLESDDPDGLRGVNQEKMAKAQQKKYPIIKGYRDQIENKYQWCIAAVPGVKWAKKLFPELRASQAVEKLWEAILHTSRADDDPVAAWDVHNKDLKARCDYLNSLGIRELQYHASNGTDLRVGLMDEGLWLGGAEKTVGGVIFNPNIPTEEVFTTPKRLCAEGFVAATKPLSFMGQVIDGFSFEFKDGRAVSCRAKRGQALLEKMIALDEDANALGEVALIGKDSPINQSGLLFYETLFDENASCHLALGMGFTNTVPGFEAMTREELTARGVNDSVHHTDFMIGADDLRVTGKTRGGEDVCVFENGLWKF